MDKIVEHWWIKHSTGEVIVVANDRACTREEMLKIASKVAHNFGRGPAIEASKSPL